MVAENMNVCLFSEERRPSSLEGSAMAEAEEEEEEEEESVGSVSPSESSSGIGASSKSGRLSIRLSMNCRSA